MPVSETADVSLAELQLATRNHGLPLEALRYPITPIGLHYLLIHYDVPAVSPVEWRLAVTGRVARPLSLSLDDLRARPREELAVTMECAGNGRARLTPRPVSQPWLWEAVGTAVRSGTRLAPLLEEAGLEPDAVEVVFAGLDHGIEGDVEQRYERSLGLHDALMPHVLLAYEVNGAPLPPQHGFPLRLVVPGWYGMTNVKWLGEIRVVDQPFRGYQMAVSYRFRQEEDEDGEPVTRMAPRALMVPPGIPDFLSRERTVSLGAVELQGRAWSGWARIAEVEVSEDGGSTWHQGTLLHDVESRFAWCAWHYTWRPAAPGVYELCCRARDEAGNQQPLDAPWNLGGYANNAVQRVRVNVV